jgi:thymidylate synthase (FAD)
MAKLVLPKTYLTGYTSLNREGIVSYLADTGQDDFVSEIDAAYKEGLSDGEVLCSFYAKLCYASLVLGKNNNITKTRAIYDNILATVDSGHGSVFEHCQLNFVVTNCSRVFTHELVRHRVGSAFSQTSGRYVRTDSISFVHDPILDVAREEIEETLRFIEQQYKKIEEKIGIKDMKDFGRKKKITSAMRRILPNGQGNEIGFSLNLRSLRHLITLRTSRHAEWEIRVIFNQVYDLISAKYPAIFADAKTEVIDGLREITFKNVKI